MAIIDDIAGGLEEIESDFGATWTPKGGTPLPINAGSLSNSAQLGTGGFAGDADGVINLRTALFTDPTNPAAYPVIKTTGTYTGPEYPNGKIFRISKITPSPGFIQLELTDPSKGV